ncbi:hypothetical protein SUGI_0383740 [Cryptomeria japonica]|nr:hypothetical protein SUGI_0383740 [Cryptomeria japonica]
MKDIHEQVRVKLKHTSEKYKINADRKRIELQYQVGDMVMIHLKKERFPKEKYTKLMMNKIGTFKILKKCGNNAYHNDFPSDIGLSPFFNVPDIYAYKNVVNDVGDAGPIDPPSPNMNADVVKWKGKPLEDSTWMTEDAIKLIGVTFSDIPTQGNLVFFDMGTMVQGTQDISQTLEDH